MSKQQRPRKAALGIAIRTLRRERGFTIERLAHAVDMHPTFVSGIERGLNNPSFATLCQLAAVLEIQRS